MGRPNEVFGYQLLNTSVHNIRRRNDLRHYNGVSSRAQVLVHPWQLHVATLGDMYPAQTFRLCVYKRVRVQVWLEYQLFFFFFFVRAPSFTCVPLLYCP